MISLLLLLRRNPQHSDSLGHCSLLAARRLQLRAIFGKLASSVGSLSPAMVVFDNHEYLTEEEKRLKEDRKRTKYWKKWGPYVAERQWATGTRAW